MGVTLYLSPLHTDIGAKGAKCKVCSAASELSYREFVHQ